MEIYDSQFTIDAGRYRMRIMRDGFRYGFEQPGIANTVEPHAVSGLSFAASDEGTPLPVKTCTLLSHDEVAAYFQVENTAGSVAKVVIHFYERHIRFQITPLLEGSCVIEARVGPLSPIYGLGDYGSQVDTVMTEMPPSRGKLDIPARDCANLVGYVRHDMVNQGTNMRFISNFSVCPAHQFAQVLFEEGSKRVAFTEDQTMLGVSRSAKIGSLYYFMGAMHEIYADYKRIRELEGYVDKKPKYTMFRVGWEAYGSLGWNTNQAEVQGAIDEYLNRGYELAWGVIGSGFWKGDRTSKFEGETTSFNIWDNEFEAGRNDGLPNPRFPNVDGLLTFFEQRGVELIVGLRNHFKAPEGDGGYHHALYNGPYMEEAAARGYLLKQADGELVRITNAQFPAGTLYVLDSGNAEALGWFVSKAETWRVKGFKEDAMIYTKHYVDGNWNRLNEQLMDRGYCVIVRNSAYSVPGDLIRINDTYYGTGAAYHFDQDRVPINLLNIAASGASNLYPDITGGTPKTDPALWSYQNYFVRNAMLNAVTPAMSMGRKPWDMQHPDYEAWVKKAADWHNRYAPYIYSAVLDGYRTGYPHAMTPLHIAYPHDPATYGLINRTTRQYEWLLGPSMLAAPLYGNDFDTAEKRDVYLPEGKWIDYETGECFQGPRILKDYPVPMWKIPIFIGGQGVVVFIERGGGEYYAEVYPVASPGTVYTYTHVDGRTQSSIVHRNEGWNPVTLRIRSPEGQVEFQYRALTGSFRFRLKPGQPYEIVGGL